MNFGEVLQIQDLGNHPVGTVISLVIQENAAAPSPQFCVAGPALL